MSVLRDFLRRSYARFDRWLAYKNRQMPPYPLDWSDMDESEWPDWYRELVERAKQKRDKP